MSSVLLGDWKGARAERLRKQLSPSFKVETIGRGRAVVGFVRKHHPHIVILPLRWGASETTSPLEKCLGFKLIQELACVNPRSDVILFDESLNQYTSSEYCQLFMNRVKAFLDESAPFFDTLLAAKASECFQRRTLSRDEIRNEAFKDLELIGCSAVMSDIRRFIIKAAGISDVPVLISGESGTGKEVIARAIHRLDPKRQEGPFIAVNCSAVSETLFESEFFGHKKGAYTGATSERPGYFRAAQNGVLFLDEISELGPKLQPKLLRVLQEGRVLSVGDESEQPVDTRVIFGTNKNLLTQISRGVFRADLYHRINVFSLHIPGLRFHKEDIEALVYFFLKRHRLCYGCPILKVDQAVLDLLGSLDFQGNVRELENLVRKILFRKSFGDTIEMSDVPPEIFQEVVNSAQLKGRRDVERFLADQVREGRSLREVIDFCERIILKKTFQETDGNRVKMARLLKTNIRTLFNKIRKHKL